VPAVRSTAPPSSAAASIDSAGVPPPGFAPIHGAGWLPGIEALRGLAAAVVVFHHLWSLSDQPRFRFYWLVEGAGSFGVNLFFLLSGFLLADYFWKSRGSWSLRTFYIRRVCRIFPAYLVNVGVLFLFFAPHDALFSGPGIRQALANLSFTHYLFPGTSSSLNVNGALWTLTIEIGLYLVMPILALAFLRRPLLAFLGFSALGVAWRLFDARSNFLFDHYFSAYPGFDPGVG
jgi:peptidoglycan/LPS O-acetylase OafA/YrhL